eukprot:403357460
MKSRKQSISSKILGTIKNIDAYGYPIGLTYKNSRTFQSTLGGAFTIAARLGIMVFFILEIINVLNKQSILKTTSYIRDLSVDQTEYLFDQENYDIAVKLQYQAKIFKGKNITDQLHKYAYAQIRQIGFSFSLQDGQVIFRQKDHVFKLVKCDSTRFKGEQVVANNLGIRDSFQCPEDLKFSLKGNFQSNFLKYLKIEILRCNQTYLDQNYQGQQCESDEDIDEVFKKLEFYVPAMNSFFDSTSYDQVIKKGIINYYFTTAGSEMSQNYFLKLGQNNVIFKDSPIFKNLNTLKPFYSLNSQVSDYFTPLADEVVTFEREVYTLFDALATTEGFIGIINIESQNYQIASITFCADL